MHRLRSQLGSLLGPRPVVLVSAALVVTVLVGAFAIEFVSSQSSSRRQAERSFAVQAQVTSELTSSLFTSSSATTAAQAAKEFGGSKPSAATLTALAKRSHLAYALILDRAGRLMAASAGTPAAVRNRPARATPHVRAALAGHSWLSNLLPSAGRSGAVIEWAFPFQTRLGRRVEVEAFDANVLSGFLGGYLSQPHRKGNQVGYVVDARRKVIADSTGQRKLGAQLPAAIPGDGQGRFGTGESDLYATSAALRGSDWRVVLTEPTSKLYPPLAGSESWILSAVLVAFGLVGAAGLALLRRTLIGAARVGEANRKLAELNATLEQRVAERTAVAEQRAEELARSNSELEQFASVASHDLQEPLRKIRMYCGRLPKRFGEGLPEEAASDLTRMASAAERMQRLIDDLLSFARVTSRKREFEAIDLGELAREVVGDLEARINELGAQVEIAALPIVSGDRAQMSQLLQNLISNALKFHRDGVPPLVRVRAQVAPAQAPRFAGESTAGNRCLITVEDNGIGFDPKYAERVFSAFERLHSRADYDGTGIGLSIARKIAWRHRGELTATSTPDVGSTFTLTLPLTQAPTEPVEEAA
jgi:signal transduction histidine kinase